MTLSVASRRIDRLQGITEQGRLVLGFIDGALDWLDWAIRDPNARYRFEDESALVAGVQTGLHGSRLLLLPKAGLLVGPARLMTLALADLRTLKRGESGAGVAVAARVEEICAGYGLVTFPRLALGATFLRDMGVDADPLFQAIGFEDRLALHDLVDGRSGGEPPTLEAQKEAAAFAIGRARTPLEFADYYRAWLHYRGAAAKAPETEIGDAVDALLPLLFPALDCPRVDGPVAAWEVVAAIDEWLTMGRRLGFPRLSHGVRQLIEHSDLAAEDIDEAPRIVAAYLAGAHALLQTGDLVGDAVGQDGASRTFQVSSGDHQAVVALGADGMITLSAYSRTVPNQAAVPSPAKGGKNGQG